VADDILIAGGGIAGLMLALSLHQIGVKARVFEAVREPRPLGVGINLQPHAVRELIELGLGPDLDRIGVRTRELVYATKRGEIIWVEPRGIAAGYAWPQYSIHRGHLHMLLLETARRRLGADRIVTGAAVACVTQTEAGVRLSLVDRAGGASLGAVDGALLIAADGIHSAIRAQFNPHEGPPVWGGAVMWRGTTIAAPYRTGATVVMAGHEWQKFACYPIADAGQGRQVINWIAELKYAPDRAWNKEDWNREGREEDFLPAFEGWRFPWLDVPALIRARSQVYEYPMVDRDPLPAWIRGRVTLIGDAAHAMYPIGSNGASQGILDARVLAREVQRHGATPAALHAYEAERRPATSAIVLANRRNGPDEVLQIVETRAPDGFDDLEHVLPITERAAIAERYKRLAGMDPAILNARPSILGAAARA
jgi:2-polyprenyl-6-methoxyphenol hydroxylase-like FAD-dependent oxidoreductase